MINEKYFHIIFALRSDARGVYYYNSYGQKRYSRCYERYALTSNDCLRGSSYRNYDYRDSYDRSAEEMLLHVQADLIVGTTDTTGTGTLADTTTR